MLTPTRRYAKGNCFARLRGAGHSRKNTTIGFARELTGVVDLLQPSATIWTEALGNPPRICIDESPDSFLMFVICLLALVLLPVASPAAEGSLLDTGYSQMYNLEFEAARATFTEHMCQYPDDPMGPTSMAAAYLFGELDRLRILQSEFFTDDDNFRRERKLTPDPGARQEFDQELAKADGLVKAVLARTPNDPHAMFAKIMICGLRADYLALIDQHYLASLRFVKSARNLAEKLLAIDPTCYDAHLAIGVENYMLSLKPAPLRWLLRLTGAETDREEGIRKLTLTAEKGHYLRPYAQLLLAVAALRDKDADKARSILLDLHRRFPNNRLYSEELSKIPPDHPDTSRAPQQGRLNK